MTKGHGAIVPLVVLGTIVALAALGAAAAQADTTQLYFGDTHLHTSYSPDAYLMLNRSASPDTAYRYAKGLPVVHPYRKARIQIHTPLDFLVVSDHAEYMGVIPKIFAGDPLVANTREAMVLRRLAGEGKEAEALARLIESVKALSPDPDLNSAEVRGAVWGEIMDAAERHNAPGTFTTFLGWEWSPNSGVANLHRVVFIKEGARVGRKFIPYTAFDSGKPEDLWRWLDETSEKSGAHFVVIPHSSNIGKGRMFPTEGSEGVPVTAEYARTRMRWEPIVEVTQIKGDSETHPSLSPDDEFADYETYQPSVGVGDAAGKATADPGDYIRTALGRGLEIEARVGANPYRVGLIGSTDSHTAMASAEEDNFHGMMALDSTPETRKAEILPGVRGWDMGAAGLTAVWAEANTREAIFDAFQRREVYATTGPRIRVRFFGGFGFAPVDAVATDVANVGYAKGVPMGGEFGRSPHGEAPSFLIHAVKGPSDANLDRIQVIKVWLDADGVAHEKVYEVALSDGRAVGRHGQVPAVGNTVDLATGRYTNTIGAAQLAVAWTDPDFDPDRRALYYARVLQIPTPRHTLYDAIALGIDPVQTGRPAVIQERAYTSPIWYTP